MEKNKDYIGKVIYNNDPTHSGRCKIGVFGLFDGLPQESVPWFYPMTGTVFGSSGAGNLSVPKIGTVVRVRFSNNDVYSGEYTCIQNMDVDMIEAIRDDYQGTHVLLYDSEADVSVMYQNESGFTIKLHDSEIRIGADGIIQLIHQNQTNIIEILDDQINIVAAGDGTAINISSGDTVDLKAQNVRINADHIDLGNKSSFHAVCAEPLQKVLMRIVDELATKSPQGSTMQGDEFNEIVSRAVTLQKNT